VRAGNGTIFANRCVDVERKILFGGIMTTDPVCGMKIDERASGFHSMYEGKKYSFCSENCKQEFEADPEEYVEAAAA
jgi:YHS domain-containing protein